MYFLGIDGGGTKTKYVIADEKGNRLAEYISGTTHYMQIGFEKQTEVIKESVNECLKMANLNSSDITSCFVATGGYGAILSDKPKIDEAITKALPACLIRIGNDMENAHAGSLAGKAGINVIAGTGSIGLGINEKNETFSSGGWGPSFGGDEGSAYWLATKLLMAFSRQVDMRDKRTKLYSYMMEKYNLNNGFDILNIIINKYKQDRTKMATFAIDVYNLALEGEETAIKIYEEAARELADIFIAIKNNLTFESEVIASFSGGVFKAGSLITEPLAKILASENITLVEPFSEPDAGSVILAMQLANVEITEEIKNNLK